MEEVEYLEEYVEEYPNAIPQILNNTAIDDFLPVNEDDRFDLLPVNTNFDEFIEEDPLVRRYRNDFQRNPNSKKNDQLITNNNQKGQQIADSSTHKEPKIASKYNHTQNPINFKRSEQVAKVISCKTIDTSAIRNRSFPFNTIPTATSINAANKNNLIQATKTIKYSKQVVSKNLFGSYTKINLNKSIDSSLNKLVAVKKANNNLIGNLKPPILRGTANIFGHFNEKIIKYKQENPNLFPVKRSAIPKSIPKITARSVSRTLFTNKNNRSLNYKETNVSMFKPNVDVKKFSRYATKSMTSNEPLDKDNLSTEVLSPEDEIDGSEIVGEEIVKSNDQDQTDESDKDSFDGLVETLNEYIDGESNIEGHVPSPDKSSIDTIVPQTIKLDIQPNLNNQDLLYLNPDESPNINKQTDENCYEQNKPKLKNSSLLKNEIVELINSDSEYSLCNKPRTKNDVHNITSRQKGDCAIDSIIISDIKKQPIISTKRNFVNDKKQKEGLKKLESVLENEKNVEIDRKIHSDDYTSSAVDTSVINKTSNRLGNIADKNIAGLTPSPKLEKQMEKMSNENITKPNQNVLSNHHIDNSIQQVSKSCCSNAIPEKNRGGEEFIQGQHDEEETKKEEIQDICNEDENKNKNTELCDNMIVTLLQPTECKAEKIEDSIKTNLSQEILLSSDKENMKTLDFEELENKKEENNIEDENEIENILAEIDSVMESIHSEEGKSCTIGKPKNESQEKDPDKTLQESQKEKESLDLLSTLTENEILMSKNCELNEIEATNIQIKTPFKKSYRNKDILLKEFSTTKDSSLELNITNKESGKNLTVDQIKAAKQEETNAGEIDNIRKSNNLKSYILKNNLNGKGKHNLKGLMKTARVVLFRSDKIFKTKKISVENIPLPLDTKTNNNLKCNVDISSDNSSEFRKVGAKETNRQRAKCKLNIGKEEKYSDDSNIKEQRDGKTSVVGSLDTNDEIKHDIVADTNKDVLNDNADDVAISHKNMPRQPKNTIKKGSVKKIDTEKHRISKEYQNSLKKNQESSLNFEITDNKLDALPDKEVENIMCQVGKKINISPISPKETRLGRKRLFLSSNSESGASDKITESDNSAIGSPPIELDSKRRRISQKLRSNTRSSNEGNNKELQGLPDDDEKSSICDVHNEVTNKIISVMFSVDKTQPNCEYNRENLKIVKEKKSNIQKEKKIKNTAAETTAATSNDKDIVESENEQKIQVSYACNDESKISKDIKHLKETKQSSSDQKYLFNKEYKTDSRDYDSDKSITLENINKNKENSKNVNSLKSNVYQNAKKLRSCKEKVDHIEQIVAEDKFPEKSNQLEHKTKSSNREQNKQEYLEKLDNSDSHKTNIAKQEDGNLKNIEGNVTSENLTEETVCDEKEEFESQAKSCDEIENKIKKLDNMDKSKENVEDGDLHKVTACDEIQNKIKKLDNVDKSKANVEDGNLHKVTDSKFLNDENKYLKNLRNSKEIEKIASREETPHNEKNELQQITKSTNVEKNSEKLDKKRNSSNNVDFKKTGVSLYVNEENKNLENITNIPETYSKVIEQATFDIIVHKEKNLESETLSLNEDKSEKLEGIDKNKESLENTDSHNIIYTQVVNADNLGNLKNSEQVTESDKNTLSEKLVYDEKVLEVKTNYPNDERKELSNLENLGKKRKNSKHIDSNTTDVTISLNEEKKNLGNLKHHSNENVQTISAEKIVHIAKEVEFKTKSLSESSDKSNKMDNTHKNKKSFKGTNLDEITPSEVQNEENKNLKNLRSNKEVSEDQIEKMDSNELHLHDKNNLEHKSFSNANINQTKNFEKFDKKKKDNKNVDYKTSSSLNLNEENAKLKNVAGNLRENVIESTIHGEKIIHDHNGTEYNTKFFKDGNKSNKMEEVDKNIEKVKNTDLNKTTVSNVQENKNLKNLRSNKEIFEDHTQQTAADEKELQVEKESKQKTKSFDKDSDKSKKSEVLDKDKHIKALQCRNELLNDEPSKSEEAELVDKPKEKETTNDENNENKEVVEKNDSLANKEDNIKIVEDNKEMQLITKNFGKQYTIDQIKITEGKNKLTASADGRMRTRRSDKICKNNNSSNICDPPKNISENSANNTDLETKMKSKVNTKNIILIKCDVSQSDKNEIESKSKNDVFDNNLNIQPLSPQPCSTNQNISKNCRKDENLPHNNTPLSNVLSNSSYLESLSFTAMDPPLPPKRSRREHNNIKNMLASALNDSMLVPKSEKRRTSNKTITVTKSAQRTNKNVKDIAPLIKSARIFRRRQSNLVQITRKEYEKVVRENLIKKEKQNKVNNKSLLRKFGITKQLKVKVKKWSKKDMQNFKKHILKVNCQIEVFNTDEFVKNISRSSSIRDELENKTEDENKMLTAEMEPTETCSKSGRRLRKTQKVNEAKLNLNQLFSKDNIPSESQNVISNIEAIQKGDENEYVGYTSRHKISTDKAKKGLVSVQPLNDRTSRRSITRTETDSKRMTRARSMPRSTRKLSEKETISSINKNNSRSTLHLNRETESGEVLQINNDLKSISSTPLVENINNKPMEISCEMSKSEEVQNEDKKIENVQSSSKIIENLKKVNDSSSNNQHKRQSNKNNIVVQKSNHQTEEKPRNEKSEIHKLSTKANNQEAIQEKLEINIPSTKSNSQKVANENLDIGNSSLNISNQKSANEKLDIRNCSPKSVMQKTTKETFKTNESLKETKSQENAKQKLNISKQSVSNNSKKPDIFNEKLQIENSFSKSNSQINNDFDVAKSCTKSNNQITNDSEIPNNNWFSTNKNLIENFLIENEADLQQESPIAKNLTPPNSKPDSFFVSTIIPFNQPKPSKSCSILPSSSNALNQSKKLNQTTGKSAILQQSGQVRWIPSNIVVETVFMTREEYDRKNLKKIITPPPPPSLTTQLKQKGQSKIACSIGETTISANSTAPTNLNITNINNNRDIESIISKISDLLENQIKSESQINLSESDEIRRKIQRMQNVSKMRFSSDNALQVLIFLQNYFFNVIPPETYPKQCLKPQKNSPITFTLTSPANETPLISTTVSSTPQESLRSLTDPDNCFSFKKIRLQKQPDSELNNSLNSQKIVQATKRPAISSVRPTLDTSPPKMLRSSQKQIQLQTSSELSSQFDLISSIQKDPEAILPDLGNVEAPQIKEETPDDTIAI